MTHQTHRHGLGLVRAKIAPSQVPPNERRSMLYRDAISHAEVGRTLPKAWRG